MMLQEWNHQPLSMDQNWTLSCFDCLPIDSSPICSIDWCCRFLVCCRAFAGSCCSCYRFLRLVFASAISCNFEKIPPDSLLSSYLVHGPKSAIVTFELLAHLAVAERWNRKNHCEYKKKSLVDSKSNDNKSKKKPINNNFKKRDNNNVNNKRGSSNNWEILTNIPIVKAFLSKENRKRTIVTSKNKWLATIMATIRDKQCEQTYQRTTPMQKQQWLLSIVQWIVMSRYCYCCERIQ